MVYRGLTISFQANSEKNIIGYSDQQMIFRCRKYLFYKFHNVADGSKLFFFPNSVEITGFKGPWISVYY
jgi:hypothetical protein